MFKILSYICFMLIAWPTMSCRAVSKSIRIVENGLPLVNIVIEPDASEQVRSAAETLKEYIQKASQAKIPIIKSTEILPIHSQAHIWVGPSKLAIKLKPTLEVMDNDGFIISFPSLNNILILGPTDWGTEFGVYEFLERYVGVRWLMPGPAGEHVPQVRKIDIPSQDIEQEPVFFSRQLSGFRGIEQKKWARRNRMHGRIKFHHNLINLFPPEQYKKTHQEFYPIYKKDFLNRKERYLPSSNKDYSWQPCFTAPKIIDEAIKNICSYFKVHPQETSYSLGVNDTHTYCDCTNCQSRVHKKKNYLGFFNYSNLYFEWANAVVTGVLKEFPNKWFGCLAYNELAEAPTDVSVHPRLIPFLTSDRMKWIQKDKESLGKNITQRWAKQASFLGWYDYIYGTPYMLPRVYHNKMADYYRFGATNEVRAMYAEAYPNFGEGAKYYITLRLLWDPKQDVARLLYEWYAAAVGENAAPFLATYYRLWEEFWTVRVLGGKWLRLGSTFLAFSSPEYLEMVKINDIEESRKLLESVIRNVQTTKEKTRAQYLFKAFEYYEASALSYLGLEMGLRQPEKNTKYYQELNKKRYLLVNEFQKDSVLIHPFRFDNQKYSNNFEW